MPNTKLFDKIFLSADRDLIIAISIRHELSAETRLSMDEAKELVAWIQKNYIDGNEESVLS